MKMAMTALAVALLAQAAPAAADPGGHGRGNGGQRAEWSGDRPQRDGGGRGDWGNGRAARAAPAAPAARAAPAAPAARPAPAAPMAGGPRWRGDGARGGPGRGGNWAGDGAQRRAFAGPGGQDADRRVEGRRWDGERTRGQTEARRDRGPGDGDRQAWTRRDADGRTWQRRDDVGRQWSRGDNDRRDWDRRDWDRRDWNRRDGDRRTWDRRDDGRRYYDDRRHDGARYAYWQRGRYPSVYYSHQRYHHRWRAPIGYYVHIWSFGDYLPRGWYGPDYWLVDPWVYDLPIPPPGYEWVRVGDDALLIDEYTGLVVQIVRDVFW